MRGTVKFFDSVKGWGFITRDNGIDYFVHYLNIQMDGYRSLDEGDIVEFEVTMEEMNPKRIHAVNVQPILTIKMVEKALKKEKLYLQIAEDDYGTYYRVVDENNVIQTGEQGMSLVEVAAYAGIDVEGLE